MKDPVLRKRLSILLAWFLAGFVIWEVFLAYSYFAFPFWGMGALQAFGWFLGWLRKRKPRLARFLKGGAAVILALCFVFFCVVEGLVVSASRGDADPESDYILVLGAAVHGTVPSRSLRERLEAAKDYLDRYPESRCIVSGGMGWREEITEAACMANWLIEQGVAPERVILEDQATSTWENLNFALDLIEAREGSRPAELAVVSSEYHLYRASLMAENLGLRFLGVPAVTHPWLNRVHYYFREFFGVVHYWVLGR